jgi:hypothetical protein
MLRFVAVPFIYKDGSELPITSSQTYGLEVMLNQNQHLSDMRTDPFFFPSPGGP